MDQPSGAVTPGGRRRGSAERRHVPARLNPTMQRAFRMTARHTARWVVSEMYRIEEHVSDPAERWTLLKEALLRVARRKA